MTTPKFWFWPDRTIGKRESRQLREEHNLAMNQRAELRELCEQSLRALHEDDFPQLRDQLRTVLNKTKETP